MKTKSKAGIKKEIDSIVKLFVKAGIPESELERCLDFPQGYLKKDYSFEMLSLFKILKIYPWMVMVAKKDYDVENAKRMMCYIAIDTMFDALKKK